jgi:broad specificity phosphatase PhoE
MLYYEKYMKYKMKYLSLKDNKLQYSGNKRLIKLFFVRHGAGIHQWGAEKKNDIYDPLEWENPCYKDALLVEEGKEEADKLKTYFEENKINLIYTSGLKRTVQTMAHALNLDDIRSKKIPIFCTDNLNEKKDNSKSKPDLPIPANCPSDKSEFIKFVQNNKYTKDIIDQFNFDDIKDSNRCVLDIGDSIPNRVDEWFNKMITYVKANETINNVGIFAHGIIIKEGIGKYLMSKFPSLSIFVRIFKTNEIILLTKYIENQKLEQEKLGKAPDQIYTKLYNCDILIFEFDINSL